MAVVQNVRDGLATEDNVNSGSSMITTEEVELSENQKHTVVDEEITNGKVEPTDSVYQNEDKEVETSKEQTKTVELDNIEQPVKKQVSFAMNIDRDSSDVSNHEMIAVENAEEKAVASSLDGRFLKFDVEIGRGSFKTVYKGLDTETGVAVAWCELQPNFPQDKKGRAEQYRFKEEAKMLKTLQHPNILRFYDSWEVPAKGSVRPDGRPDRKILVLITELMTSGTLKGYLRRFKDVRPKIIRSWGRQILKGLNYLHTRTPPIIHRDLKCDNIFINGTTGMVKIGDLGLATLKRSHVKTVIGTPEFMAPEMYDEHYDESVDVYAFGMCLLEMTTLQYPYMECTNPGQIYKRVTQGKKPNAIEKVKDPLIRKIIIGCIEEAKENRYTVKNLLALPFFSELETIEIKATPSTNDDEVRLVFQVPIKGNKGQNQSQQQQPTYETYEKLFNLHSDQAQSIAQDMVKLNVIREAEVETMTKSIQAKVNEVKHTRMQSADATSLMMQHNSLSVDQDVTYTGSEFFKKPDYAISTPVEEDKNNLETTLPNSVVDSVVEADTNGVSKLPTNATTEKPQQPPTVLETTSTTTKLTENGDKKNLPSPDAATPTPLLPTSITSQSNSPSHRLKEQSLHSRESSSDLSQAGDSQVSMTKESVLDSSAPTTGEIKKQKSRENEKEVDEQPEPPTATRDTSQQESSKNTDAPVKVLPPAQQPPQQPSSSQQQQKKSRTKTTKEKRPLKLTIVGRDQDLVECNLTNGGQTITFKFSLDGDSSEQIAQGMVSANYLSENQKDEFKEYAEKMIKMARQNETGVVGGSATSLHPADNKTGAAVSQKEGDSEHKLLEKSESGSKLATPIGGVDSVTKPVDPGSAKVTIASQTSMDCESQADHVDSPPPSSPTTTSGDIPVIDIVVNTQQTKSTIDLERCSIQDVCPTTEYQTYSSSVTTTNQDVSDSTVLTSTTSSFGISVYPPVASLFTPPTTSLSTTTVVTSSISLPSTVTIEKKFTVEIVSDESDNELMEEPVENFGTVSDTLCGQDERFNTIILADAISGDDGGRIANFAAACSFRSDSSNSFYDDKVQRVSKTESSRTVYHHSAPSPVFTEHTRAGGHVTTERPSEKFTMENLSMLSESFSVLMYTILQVLRNPAMESFVNDLDSKYGGGGSGLVAQEYNQDPEYQSLQMKFAEEERSLKEHQRRRMDDFLQRKRHSATASPVGSHRSPSTSNTSSSTKARLQHQHNDFMAIPIASTQLPHSNLPHVQQHNYYTGLMPEGESMERKIKQALMTELSPRPSKSDLSTRSFQKTDNNRLQPKSTTQLPQQAGPLHQGYQASSTSVWPGDDFHSGSSPSMEMTPEPPTIFASNSKHKFDTIETKSK